MDGKGDRQRKGRANLRRAVGMDGKGDRQRKGRPHFSDSYSMTPTRAPLGDVDTTRAPLGDTTVTRPLAPFDDATGPSSATTGRPTTIAATGAFLRQARNAQRPRPHPQHT